MKSKLCLQMLPQPDDVTCGPTCLQAVYDYFGDRVPLQQVISEIEHLEEGGTLAVFLGCHALRRGYDATIYTYNLHTWDPTWFKTAGVDLRERLELQQQEKHDRKLRKATAAYLEYLSLGGVVRHAELTTGLLRSFLKQGVPILTGLSATYLYDTVREIGATNEDDDIRGEPVGHFVVLSGYDMEKKTVHVADPYARNPLHQKQHYEVGISRALGAILLAIITYDANFLIVEPKSGKSHRHA